MKKKMYRQLKDKQRELRRCKEQVDRAIMLDLCRSYHAIKELMLDKAAAHMVLCIHNTLDNGDAVTADVVASFAETVRKTLPVELHREWAFKWKNKTSLALESDIYLPGMIPLNDWVLT